METNVSQSFKNFLDHFVPILEKKTLQAHKACWILETTGSQDAADLQSDFNAEIRILQSDPEKYQKLLSWEGKIQDPILKRQLNILIRAFLQNQVAPKLLKELSQKESQMSCSYASFRPELNGKKISENEIRDILKKEKNVEARKKGWEASKQIGIFLAPQILELVKLRNTMAKSLGYPDFFQMQLSLQEVDKDWLLQTLDDLAQKSDSAYTQLISEIEKRQSSFFGVPTSALGPWSWSDPFCQEDPLDSEALDELVEGVDIVAVSTSFYDRMGIDVRPILKRSDMFERPQKNQHAFCLNVDRKGDVRTLNNIKSSLKWLETALHEYGHAIYDICNDPHLPWLLREPPHMITTEAMALLAGRQAYQASSLPLLVGRSPKKESLFQISDESLRRRQLIFSRWVLVMTAFESALYQDPNQNLNRLWWECVEKYQKIKAPPIRKNAQDWAAKYHIGLAPVYYFSYLLGEMFASAIQETLKEKFGSPEIATPEAGSFLQEKLFKPGNRMRWDELIQHVTGHPLSPNAWVSHFCGKKK